ncbi:hypothetical protein ACLK25_18850, partial [Leptospira kirschneri]|uniref:hypothetical protein n=1 Tax=Leptospira kirschneri TaxID=29507 RepID=UPI00398A84C4
MFPKEDTVLSFFKFLVSKRFELHFILTPFWKFDYPTLKTSYGSLFVILILSSFTWHLFEFF